MAQSTTFSWTADVATSNPSTNAVGYNVHIGTASGQYTMTDNATNLTKLTVTNLTIGQRYYAVVKAYNAAGIESGASNEVTFIAASAGSTPFTIGAAVIYTAGDNGNGGGIFAQRADLPKSGTLKSISFYVNTAAGTLQLAIYSGISKPTTLIASTPVFNAVHGWNTKQLTPTVLQKGKYWLAYVPSSNNLSFWVTRTYGTTFYAPANSAPNTFPTNVTQTLCQWSFYATLT